MKKAPQKILYQEEDTRSSFLRNSLLDLPTYRSRGLLYLTLLMVLSSLLWAWFSKIDVIVNASAIVVPDGQIKLVQTPVAGVIKEILVQEGEKVEKDQALFVVKSEKVEQLLSNLKSFKVDLEEVNRQWSEILPLQEKQLLLEIKLTKEKLKKQESTLSYLKKKIKLKKKGFLVSEQAHKIAMERLNEKKKRLNNDVKKNLLILEISEKQVSMLKNLQEKGLSSSIESLEMDKRQQEAKSQVEKTYSLLREIEEEYKQEHNNLVSLKYRSQSETAELEESKQNTLFTVASTSSEILQKENTLHLNRLKIKDKKETLQSHYQQLLAKVKLNLTGVSPKVLQESLQKDEVITNLFTLSAFTSGTVSRMTVYDQGEVIALGKTLLEIVPKDAKLIVELKINHQDIGFIQAGQKVKLKFAAFPYAEHGAIHGKLVRILPNAELDKNLTSHFRAICELETNAFYVRGEEKPLLSGMIASAEIVTERRRILALLLHPLKTL